MNRHLSDYLPQFMRKYNELEQIMNAEQPEIEDAWDGVGEVLSNQFVDTSTEYGISRWEKMLGITPYETDTLQERKFRVKANLLQQTPYTFPKLVKYLNEICGEGNFEMDFGPVYEGDQNLTLVVKLALEKQTEYDALVDLLNRILPCNIVRQTIVLWNTHETLSSFTNEELAEHTHDELRKESLL